MEKNEDIGESAAERLRQLMRTKKCIAYHLDLPDPEHNGVFCSIFGAPKSNELFVRLVRGDLEFVAVEPSPIAFPAMIDRILGLHPEDHRIAFELADRLWEEHRAELVPSRRRR